MNARTAEVDEDLAAAVTYTSRLRTGFYVVVLLVALGGQVTGAVETLHMPWYVALPAVGALELGGMVVLSNADVRRRLGERAVASRVLSAGIAAFAVVFNWAGHGDHLQGAFYAGMSALGYLVWLMSTENNRRDRLRAKGQLPPTAPAYPAGQWTRHPWLTSRARHLALADPTLGLYGSLAAAAAAVRAERRHAGIADVLRRKLSSIADPAVAQIAVAVYDLDEIARRLAAAADYDGLTGLIAADLDPGRLTGTPPAALVPAELPPAVPDPPRPVRRRGPAKTTRPRRAPAATLAMVEQLRAQDPAATQAQLAERLGISTRRLRAVLGAANTPAGPVNGAGA